MKYIILTIVCLLLIAGCASVETTTDVTTPENAVVCTPEQKQAQMCTMEYAPVCGYDAAGNQVGTGGNKCGSCADPAVVYYIPGECPVVNNGSIDDSLGGCSERFWFDDTNKECGSRTFCGAFMYYGLHTYETQAECLADLS